MKNPNIKIIVCAHKADFCKSDNVYMPIHVGRAFSDIDLGFIGDNTGDNISEKNRSFCELTGMYWAWKNLKVVDYIGINHYRRYFLDNKLINFKDLYISKNENTKYNVIDHDIVEKYLEKYDVILPRKKVFVKSIWKLWSEMHNEIELIVTENIIKEFHPDYLNSFDYIFKRNNKASQYCMFIMNWEYFDKYCKWIFGILFKVEDELEKTNPGFYKNSRIYGFLAEHLINVYFHSNNSKIKYLPILQLSNDTKRLNTFRYCVSRVKSNLRYIFGI